MIFITLLMLTATSIAANSSTLTSAKHAPLTSATFASPTSIFVRPIKVLVILCAIVVGSLANTDRQFSAIDLSKRATKANLILSNFVFLEPLEEESAPRESSGLQNQFIPVNVPADLIESLSMTLREIVRFANKDLFRGSPEDLEKLENFDSGRPTAFITTLAGLSGKNVTSSDVHLEDARRELIKQAIYRQDKDDSDRTMTTFTLHKLNKLALAEIKKLLRLRVWTPPTEETRPCFRSTPAINGTRSQAIQHCNYISNLHYLIHYLHCQLRTAVVYTKSNEPVAPANPKLATITNYLRLISRPSANTQL